ncbi:hypothetical protein [Achromobacter insolitus]|uniref:hypothetical protein n=1 Tax=Achromobacter insolitus TaxID=217204 RepID=UPI0013E3DC3D|nr:hypothetical protein [Achromobacter insolitus]NGT13653.1 hypothetical protein [Achromobacter insolitus]
MKKLSESSFYATQAGAGRAAASHANGGIGWLRKNLEEMTGFSGLQQRNAAKTAFSPAACNSRGLCPQYDLDCPGSDPSRGFVLVVRAASQFRYIRLPVRAQVTTFTENAPSGAFSTFVWETTCLPFL